MCRPSLSCALASVSLTGVCSDLFESARAGLRVWVLLQANAWVMCLDRASCGVGQWAAGQTRVSGFALDDIEAAGGPVAHPTTMDEFCCRKKECVCPR